MQLTKGHFALQLCEIGELRRHVGRGVDRVFRLFSFFYRCYKIITDGLASSQLMSLHLKELRIFSKVENYITMFPQGGNVMDIRNFTFPSSLQNTETRYFVQ